MALRVSTQYDGAQALAQRLAQNREDNKLDPQVVALAEKNKKEVLAKRAGVASMQRLKQEYKDQGIDMEGEMDADGNMSWDYRSNIFDKVKAAGKDLSTAPKNEFASRAQVGDAQINNYAAPDKETGRLATTVSGDAEGLLAAQHASAQSAQRQMPQQTLQPLADAKFQMSSIIPQQAQVPTQAPTTTLPAIGKPAQTAAPAQPMQGSLPDRKVSIGEDYKRSVSTNNSDSYSGGNNPLISTLNYDQSGYEDPGQAQAAMRLRNAMYGAQGDVLRNTGIQEGATAEETRGRQDVEQLNARYKDYNSSVMQPKLQGSVQGGNISQSSSQHVSNSQTIDQSRKETDAQKAAAALGQERNSMNMLSGNKITHDGNGKIVYGTEAEPADLEGTRFFEDVVQGKVKGVQLDSRGKIVFQPGADVRKYVDELRGRVANKGATGVSDNTLPAATKRAAGMRDLGAVQGQQRQVGNPDPSSAPNFNQVFDPKRQDSLLNAAQRLKKNMRRK